MSEVKLVNITVRNLDNELEKRLRERAQVNGRSMEEEAGNILRRALEEARTQPQKLGAAIHEVFKPSGGVELDIPPREPMPESPNFD